MGVTVATTRVACDTSTGTQDITTADLGDLTPKAALFIVVEATTDGVAADNSTISYGAATGASNLWVVGGADLHNSAGTDTHQWFTNTQCVELRDSAGVLTAQADFDSFITNGVRIDWGDAPPSAWLMTVILFAGTDLSVHAGSFGIGNIVNNTIDVTDPGFEPDLLFSAVACGLVGAGSNDHMELSFGMVHNDGESTITQRFMHRLSQSNQADGRALASNNTSYGIGEYTTLDIDWGGEFHTFDSNGFSCSARINPGNNRVVSYLALNFGEAVSSKVITYNTPTSNGSDEESGIGFEPQLLFALGGFQEVLNCNSGDNILSCPYLFTVWDNDEQYSSSGTTEKDATTTNTQSLSDNVAVELPDHDGSAGLTATLTSFDNDGFTLNYSAVESNAKIFFMLAIEGEAEDEKLPQGILQPKRNIQIPIHQLGV